MSQVFPISALVCFSRILARPLRHRCDLLRGLARLRLRRLSRCVVELPVNVLASFPELVHALPQAPRQVRQLFRPEEDKEPGAAVCSLVEAREKTKCLQI